MPSVTPITPPRVAFLDPRTGLVSREWYLFFLSLYTSVSGSDNITLEDLQKVPQAYDLSGDFDLTYQESVLSSYQPPMRDPLTDELAQELHTQPRNELGTMASVQQDNVRFIGFSQYPSPAIPADPPVGTLWWDNDDNTQTLNLRMNGTHGVVQQIGQETYYRVKASSAITDGQVVMFTGTVGASGGLRAAPATGLTPSTASYVMGVATENIANNGWGYVTAFGEVKGINTTGGAEAWANGTLLYYDPATPGKLTKNVPAAPNAKILVAAVVYAATNGILFVRPTFGGALGDFEGNVQVTSPANGNLLIYDAVESRWENASLTAGTGISVTNGAGNITVATTGAISTSAPVTISADYTVAATDSWIINNKSGSSCVLTLPSAATYSGRAITVQNYQNQTVASVASNVVPLGGGSASTAILPAVVGDWATIVSNGSNWVIMQAATNNNLLLE